MAVFLYRAKSLKDKGKISRGKIEAPTMETAIEILRNQDLVIVDLFEEADIPFYAKNIKVLQKVAIKDIVIFSREVSVMVSSGISLLDSISIIKDQTSSQYFRSALEDVANSIDGGMQFSEAIEKHKDIFSPFYVEMVRAGELSGSLEAVLLYLADYVESSYRVKRKVRGAMIYPLFVIVVFIGFGGGLLIFIVPNLVNLILERGGELPFITSLVLDFSDLLRGYWYLILGGLIVVVGAFVNFIRTENGRIIFDKYLLRMPIIGNIIILTNINQLIESMHILIKGGIPIAESLRISASVVGSTVFKDILNNTRNKVIEGNRIAPVFASYDVMPPLLSRMFSAGEETGKLESILESLHAFYQDELSEILENVSSIIQPILIVMLGVGVFIFILAVLLPVYNSLQV